MMRSFCLGSGSAGNCFYIESVEKYKILVDLGFSFKRTKEILDSKGVSIYDIDTVFITHEHSDHCAGLDVFLKKVKDVKIYLTKGTFSALKLSGICLDRFVFIGVNDIVSVNDVKVLVVSKSHDSCEPVSFVFENCGIKLGIFTDLGYVNNPIKHIMSDVDVLYLEANYCESVISNTDNNFHFNYINRLSSDIGHLSLRTFRKINSISL